MNYGHVVTIVTVSDSCSQGETGCKDRTLIVSIIIGKSLLNEQNVQEKKRKIDLGDRSATLQLSSALPLNNH